MSVRVPGHAHSHLANRADMTWVWQCECGTRQRFVALSKKSAVAQHRDHKVAVRAAAALAHGEATPDPEGAHREQ